MRALPIPLLPLLACLAWPAPAGGQTPQEVVLYGDDSYPPYSFVEQGQFKGLYVDMIRKAAEALAPEYRVEFRALPWRRGLAELELGTAFALFSPGMKTERPFISDYSTELFRETVVLFCNEDVMKTARSVFPRDFLGLSVGVNAGFLLSERLQDAAKSHQIRLEQAKGADNNLRKLALKRIDCYATDRGAGLYGARGIPTAKGARGLRLIEAVELAGESTYIGYSAHNNPPYKAAFIKKMDAALDALKKTPAMTRIEQEYLR